MKVLRREVVGILGDMQFFYEEASVVIFSDCTISIRLDISRAEVYTITLPEINQSSHKDDLKR